jgi:hypothetical protein
VAASRQEAAVTAPATATMADVDAVTAPAVIPLIHAKWHLPQKQQPQQ